LFNDSPTVEQPLEPQISALNILRKVFGKVAVKHYDKLPCDQNGMIMVEWITVTGWVD